MSLRVISGAAKGRKLQSIPGDVTRPITDRVKEALFDIIGPDVIGSSWWDLFAGTGAVGIEALSRGAAFSRFTDSHAAPVRIIQANLAATRLAARAEVTRGDAFSALQAGADQGFHYIYIAPPQHHEYWSKAMKLLDGNVSWLAEDGWAIVQIAPKELEALKLINLHELERRKYGTTLLVFYSRSAT